ncbi:MAG: 50S ribosomal protein L10 [Gemmatimonadota bacterium]|jgi:large subunit ribosomal protein L10
MKRTSKESFVTGFRDRVRSAPVFYLTDFSGLDVKSMTELRHRLRAAGAEYVVVKNRLVLRALRELDLELPELAEHLAGPTGIVIAGESPVESAKALAEFAKGHEDRPVFKIGLVDKNIVAAGQFARLAKLPPRDELLAQLAGALQAPLAAFVGILEAKLQEAAGLLESLRAKKESEEK